MRRGLAFRPLRVLECHFHYHYGSYMLWPQFSQHLLSVRPWESLASDACLALLSTSPSCQDGMSRFDRDAWGDVFDQVTHLLCILKAYLAAFGCIWLYSYIDVHFHLVHPHHDVGLPFYFSDPNETLRHSGISGISGIWACMFQGFHRG